MSDDFIPDSQFVPDSHSGPSPIKNVKATAPDFIPDEHFQSDEDKYGSVGQQALTGLESAASGATLGLAPLAETKLLGVNPEDIKARQQANPATNLVGNIAGSSALIGLTGGVAAPAEGALLGTEAMQAGAQAAKAAIASGATETAASQVAINAARAAAGSGRALAARAAAFGAEGAVFGAGNSISDYALGDPNLNAQKVLSNIGLGALFGAGIGAIAHGASGLIGKRVGDIADKANAAAETSDALSGSNGITNSTPGDIGGGANGEIEKGSLFNPVDKKVAPELRRIGEEYDLPVVNGMTSANPDVQHATDALARGAPSIAAGIVKNDLRNGWNGATEILTDVLDTGQEFGGGRLTKATTGEAIQNALINKLKQDGAPLEDMFQTLKQGNIEIPVDVSETKKVIGAIKELSSTRLSGVGQRLSNEVLENIPKLRNAEEVSQYAASLRGEIEGIAPGNKKYVVGQLQDLLNGLYEKSVEKAASNPDLPEEMQEIMKGQIDAWKAAKAASGALKEKYNPIMKQLGAKIGYGFGTQSMINQLQDMNVEDFTKYLFDKGSSEFNAHMEQHLPNEFALLKQYQKQTLADLASKATGEFNPRTFLKSVSKTSMEPETLNKIFSPDEVKKINDMRTYIENFPKKFNSSDTDNSRDFRSFFELGKAGLQEGRDFSMLAYIKTAGRQPGTNPFILGKEVADKFNKFSAIKAMTDEVDQEVTQGAKSIFNVRDAIRGATIKAATLYSPISFDKASKDIKNLADNPAGIVDHFAKHTEGLNNALPNITQSLNTASISALSFLNSKLPRPASTHPMSEDYKPSPAEESKFMRYFNAVNNPVGVLEQVKKGTLSNEALEVLHVVHPDLLAQMQKEVQTQLVGIKADKIPYSVKMSVAKFLGKPLDSSMLPQVIQSNQASLAGPQLGNSSAAPTGRRAGSMKALNLPSRVRTQTQDDELDTK